MSFDFELSRAELVLLLKEMYMHKNKKIIICKFNLKNKCKLGEKCKFKHLNLNELNEILNKFEGLKQEYESLKKNFKENGEKLGNFDKKLCDVTDNNINTFSKLLYSSNKKLNLLKLIKKYKDYTKFMTNY